MTTMKALRFEKYGPPSVLSIRELRVPDLRAGEALVELHASAINPSDVKGATLSFSPQMYPKAQTFEQCANAENAIMPGEFARQEGKRIRGSVTTSNTAAGAAALIRGITWR